MPAVDVQFQMGGCAPRSFYVNYSEGQAHSEGIARISNLTLRRGIARREANYGGKADLIEKSTFESKPPHRFDALHFPFLGPTLIPFPPKTLQQEAPFEVSSIISGLLLMGLTFWKSHAQ